MPGRTVKDATISLNDVVEIAGFGEFVVGEVIQRGNNRVSIRLDRKFNTSMTLEVLQRS